MFQTLLDKSIEFWMRSRGFPSGGKIEVRCFAVLLLTKFMLLMMGLSGVPSSCIFGRPCQVPLSKTLKPKLLLNLRYDCVND